MSTRKLQAEIERVNAENEKRQVTMEQLMAREEENAAKIVEAEKAIEAADALREELRKAQAETSAANARAGDAVKRAENTSKENLRLKQELEAEKARTTPAPVIEQVEVTSPEVEQELEQLRERAKNAPNEDIILLRDAYKSLVKQFERVEEMVVVLESTQPEEAARYRKAVAAAATAPATATATSPAAATAPAPATATAPATGSPPSAAIPSITSMASRPSSAVCTRTLQWARSCKRISR